MLRIFSKLLINIIQEKHIVSLTILRFKMNAHKWILLCQNNSHKPIDLPNEKTVAVGRNPLTKIKDTKVSRKHVELTANYSNAVVMVKQLGVNPSNVDGVDLHKGESTQMKPGSILQILHGTYPHIINMAKAPLNKEKKAIKRTLSDDSGTSNKKPRQDGWKNKEDSSDSDEAEHMAEIEKKLQLMRKSFQTSTAKTGQEAKLISTEPSESPTAVPVASSRWEEHGRLWVHYSKGVIAKEKIAAFDVDGTIITTQSGKVFPTHSGDWKIMYPQIPSKIRELHNDGYKIVFITNQLGIQRGKVKPDEFKKKIAAIIGKLAVPVMVLVSTGIGKYRKPGLGMWKYLIEQGNDGVSVRMDKSLFVGDAAGRPAGWETNKKKDFSCGDRLFSINAGLKFYTPEEYFLGKRPAEFNMPKFDPRKLDPSSALCDPACAKLTSSSKEVIVLVGCPASGKSFFAREHLVSKGYDHISRDKLGSWQKCVKAAQQSLEKGNNVVVDNTNPDPESRKRYIDVAKSAGICCRCFIMQTTLEHVKHNERFREMTDSSHVPINEIIIHGFMKKLVQPTTEEGFQEIVKINVVPKFKNKDHEELYKMFLIEK